MRLLLVEDRPEVALALSRLLRIRHYSVDVASSLEEARLFLRSFKDYGAVILDLGLPDGSGENIISDLRGRHRKDKSYVPILVVSGLADTATRVRLLNAGADDVLVKPFDKEELFARLRAVMRRPNMIVGERYVVGPLSYDPVSEQAWYGDVLLQLTRSEKKLLSLLMQKAGKTVRKESLLSHMYDMDSDYPEVKILDVFICKLRKKIRDVGGNDRIIRTVWGCGYMIVEDGAPEDSGAAIPSDEMRVHDESLAA